MMQLKRLWIEAARELARNLHAGQRDKAGVDYFSGHLTAVAEQGRTILEVVAGYLHDASEDTPHTVAEVLRLLEVRAGQALPAWAYTQLEHCLNLLNHHSAPTRETYIEAIAKDKLATAVKLHDLQHNMQISRLPSPTPKDYERLERYQREHAYLSSRHKKPILYIEMDNVLVDFESGIAQLDEAIRESYAGRLDEVPGIFALMQPHAGAVEAVLRLCKTYEVYVLSTAPWLNASAWSDKLDWVQRHFGVEEGSPLYKRLILSHHKNLNKGDIFIDDCLKNGVVGFCGEHIHFGTEACPDWSAVLALLQPNTSLATL